MDKREAMRKQENNYRFLQKEDVSRRMENVKANNRIYSGIKLTCILACLC